MKNILKKRKDSGKLFYERFPKLELAEAPIGKTGITGERGLVGDLGATPDETYSQTITWNSLELLGPLGPTGITGQTMVAGPVPYEPYVIGEPYYKPIEDVLLEEIQRLRQGLLADVIVKCEWCGQWGAVKTQCKHCGQPMPGGNG